MMEFLEKFSNLLPMWAVTRDLPQTTLKKLQRAYHEIQMAADKKKATATGTRRRIIIDMRI